jgi:glycosyltransferase involved in cell wall biosynthesis
MYGTKRRKHPNSWLGFQLNRHAITAAHHAFTNNLHDIPALARVLPSERVTYLPPGIFPEEFSRYVSTGRLVRERHHIPLEVPLLMTAARFRPGAKWLSLEYLFRSLAPLAGGSRPFMLLVVGDGPLEREVKTMAANLLPGRAVFAGRVPHECMAGYYAAADIFVFPGIGESLGMVFLEAQSCGLPVVALDTAGVPQVVLRDQTGILVAEDGGPALAEAVSRLLDDEALRTRLGGNGPRFIRKQRNLWQNYRKLGELLADIGRSP